jgi:hypothetical protein
MPPRRSVLEIFGEGLEEFSIRIGHRDRQSPIKYAVTLPRDAHMGLGFFTALRCPSRHQFAPLALFSLPSLRPP